MALYRQEILQHVFFGFEKHLKQKMFIMSFSNVEDYEIHVFRTNKLIPVKQGNIDPMYFIVPVLRHEGTWKCHASVCNKFGMWPYYEELQIKFGFGYG